MARCGRWSSAAPTTRACFRSCAAIPLTTTSFPASGDTDDRVHPAHSYKFAARLQAEAAAGTPVLLNVEADAGHGAGSRRSQVTASAADRLAFTLHHLGMGLPPAFPGGEPAVSAGGTSGH